MSEKQAYLAVLIIALVTAALRFLPFLIFGRGRRVPPMVEKLGGLLPAAVMGMLVVFCLKGTDVTSLEGWVPPLVGCLAVGLSYLWKRNTLISILLGTLSYMFLVQFVF